MDVIIVSKTRMASGVCVGGILENGRAVRLLTKAGHNQEKDTKINIGDVYSIKFAERNGISAPHTEDVLVNSLEYKFNFSSIKKMVDYLFDNIEVKFWAGEIEELFDGKLHWTSSGSGYISKKEDTPKNSVGFWMPSLNLTRNDFNNKVRYSFQEKNITYVGLQPPIDVIPAGCLIRVSLARWWSPNDDEERCYLQLSGWYLDTK